MAKRTLKPATRLYLRLCRREDVLESAFKRWRKAPEGSAEEAEESLSVVILRRQIEHLRDEYLKACVRDTKRRMA